MVTDHFWAKYENEKNVENVSFLSFYLLKFKILDIKSELLKYLTIIESLTNDTEKFQKPHVQFYIIYKKFKLILHIM